VSDHGGSRAPTAVVATRDEIESFWERGFVAIERPIVTPGDLDHVRARLDDLFSNPSRVATHDVHDLGGSGQPGLSVPEIAWVSNVVPELLRSQAFQQMRALADALLGERSEMFYEHAIVKPALTGGTTEWHQDVAFNLAADVRMVSVWLALQPTDEANGCMRFIPGSNLGPILPHRLRGGHALQAIDVDSRGAVSCPLPAGGVTVHLQRTIHATGPNTSAAARAAWIIKFVPDRRRLHRRIGHEVATTLRIARARSRR
jgi:hypothetical protein